MPETLRASLVRLGEAVQDAALWRAELRNAVARLEVLSPDAVARADGEIAGLARLYHRHQADRWTPLPRPPGMSDDDLLQATPGLEYLFVFHRDGRLREAALNRFEGGAKSPFFFAAIAYRLNDWALPVRAAARACAERVFPRTDAATVAAAGVFLLSRRQQWRRWGEEAAILDDALARSDVTDRLAGIVRTATSGPMGTLLRHALRRPEMDRHLLNLATTARQPAVRVVALRSLIEGRVTWPIGVERQWLDKVYNKSRRIPLIAGREIARLVSLEALITRGARDQSAAVRRVAADGLIRHRSLASDLDEVVRLLAGDRSASVRERAAFVLRRSS